MVHDLFNILNEYDIDILNLNQDTINKIDNLTSIYNEDKEDKNKIYSSSLLSFLLIEHLTIKRVDTVYDVNDQASFNKINSDIIKLKNNKPNLSKIPNNKIVSSIILNTTLKKYNQFLPTNNIEKSNIKSLEKQIKKTFKQELNQITSIIKSSNDDFITQLEQFNDQFNFNNVTKKAILQTIDYIKEQTKYRDGKPGEINIPSYDHFYPENYTKDKNWMTSVNLQVKNTKVWLDQLSKKYNRSINKLDQIPLEELEYLANNGFNALWLIGIWQRSTASKKIKENMNNYNSGASAYSIYDYIISEDLGGTKAYEKLNKSAQLLGIKIGCDIVPNHTGIYSKWIIEHPEYFIQTNESPFQNYNFNSPNLSEHKNIELYIDQNYYEKTDAAVVFKYVNSKTNQTNYIYHGNDGTNIPWNDTAQLNFLKSEVRSAVIDIILNIAKKFSIIRLDAAMVLTKEHFQRLWYPIPGSGGDIPSRSRLTITNDQFHQLFPDEFWSEVMTRIEKEAPNTLLIAEAFWMMESYFVRTLGVHRVYNSAFMHMIRDQKNKEYRQIIKSTLEYDPRILHRYVNFLSNPDEAPASQQFGKSDKYFGSTVLMITLPGTPMFNHGQIEGATKKFGMEFSQDIFNEPIDENLVNIHKEIIFPLLKIRNHFSDVVNFRFYDVHHNDNYVIEDFYAYSNKYENNLNLIIYNNSIEQNSGWINLSTNFNLGVFDEKEDLIQHNIFTEINSNQENVSDYCIFKNFYGNQFFIQKLSNIKEKGIYVSLKGYQFKIYTNFVILPKSKELDSYYSTYDHKEISYEALPKIIKTTLNQLDL